MYTTDDLDISVATITGDESTIILDFSVNPPVPVNPPPAPPPAPAPAPSPAPPTDGLAGKPVVVTGTLSDGTTINVSLYPGQRSPLITSTLIGSVVYHADGLSVCIENAYMGTTTDLSGTFTITAGDAQVFSGPLTIWCYSRTRPFWLSSPTLTANPDLSPFPKYGPGSESASSYDRYINADNSPMGIGLACPAMETTGERDDMGPLPAWDASYLTNPNANNALVVRGMSDAACPWPFHVIDPATQKMVDLSTNPFISMLDSMRTSNGNPIVPFTTACKLSLQQAQAHAPMFSALAASIYATDFDKEELSLWCNYVNALWANPGYRLPSGVFTQGHSQTRGKGRGLVALVYAAKLSDNQAYFDKWMHAVAADSATTFLAQPGLPCDQTQLPANAGRLPPWEQAFIIGAYGQAIDVGYTEYQPLLDYFEPFASASLLDISHEFATLYELVVWQHGTQTMVNTWPEALAATVATSDPSLAVQAANLAKAMTFPESSQGIQDAMGAPPYAIPGDFLGYPTSASGYPAMAQGMYAANAKHATNQVRAQAAWDKFKQYSRVAPGKYDVVP